MQVGNRHRWTWQLKYIYIYIFKSNISHDSEFERARGYGGKSPHFCLQALDLPHEASTLVPPSQIYPVHMWPLMFVYLPHFLHLPVRWNVILGVYLLLLFSHMSGKILHLMLAGLHLFSIWGSFSSFQQFLPFLNWSVAGMLHICFKRALCWLSIRMCCDRSTSG